MDFSKCNGGTSYNSRGAGHNSLITMRPFQSTQINFLQHMRPFYIIKLIKKLQGLNLSFSYFALGPIHLKSENATPSQIQTMKRSLQLVKTLSHTIGSTRKHLQREISNIVITIIIRNVLRHGEKHPFLQKSNIRFLNSLTLEQYAMERIIRGYKRST